MKFQDAIQNRIKRIRLPVWEPTAYVDLPLFADGGIGPLARVHDVTGDVMIGMWHFNEDTSDLWEPVEVEITQT